MTDPEPDLATRLVKAVSAALFESLGAPEHLDHDEYDPEARAATITVLKTLVDEHFPDDDVDYHYACEGLAQDACDTLRQLDEAEDQ